MTYTCRPSSVLGGIHSLLVLKRPTTTFTWCSISPIITQLVRSTVSITTITSPFWVTNFWSRGYIPSSTFIIRSIIPYSIILGWIWGPFQNQPSVLKGLHVYHDLRLPCSSNISLWNASCSWRFGSAGGASSSAPGLGNPWLS